MIDREAELRGLMMAAVEGGSADASRLLRALAPPLRAFVRRQLKRHGMADEDCEDILQEVLIAIHVKRHTYDPNVPFTAWVHAIARYKIVDGWRRSRRLHEALPIEEASHLFADDEVEAATASRDLATALTNLPERTRQLITLTKLDGLSMAEAANRSGMSETAAKVAVHRGLKRLAALFRAPKVER